MDELLKTDTGRSPIQQPNLAARMTNEIGEKAGQARDAAADLGRKTVERIDAQRTPAAETLDHTASALHRRADSAVGVVQATADTLHATAEYVRQHDIRTMLKDVEGLVRRYPGPALAVAAAAGFLVARVARTRM
jgi:ElaB/YqjD/DUF883 family membrane-anchored ribosome-binding protein